jgi:uncharacterized Zn finger protein (UPF0148 family)
MPDRYAFTWPFRDGTVVCLTCNARYTGLSEREKERHYRQHVQEAETARRRTQTAQLREARRLKAQAARENKRLEERGLY